MYVYREIVYLNMGSDRANSKTHGEIQEASGLDQHISTS
jgi:hypothetical protein